MRRLRSRVFCRTEELLSVQTSEIFYKHAHICLLLVLLPGCFALHDFNCLLLFAHNVAELIEWYVYAHCMLLLITRAPTEKWAWMYPCWLTAGKTVSVLHTRCCCVYLCASLSWDNLLCVEVLGEASDQLFVTQPQLFVLSNKELTTGTLHHILYRIKKHTPTYALCSLIYHWLKNTSSQTINSWIIGSKQRWSHGQPPNRRSKRRSWN